MAKFRIDVDGKKVGDRIRRRIEDGIDKAASEISHNVERTAKDKIRAENAIWRKHLLEGFADARLEFGDRTVVSVRNVSNHAAAQEHGVNGVSQYRGSKYSYTDKRPPLDELIPWVEDNLDGFWPDDLDRPDGGDGSSSSGTSGGGGGDGDGGGSGGTDSDPYHGHDPLMGADELEKGTEVTTDTSYGIRTGTITKVAADLDNDDLWWDYEVRHGDGYIGVTFDQIVDWPGKGADPADVEAGKTVFVGEYTDFGKISDVITDPETGEIIGAQVIFSPNETPGESFDLSQFEIADDVTPFSGDDNDTIVTDSDGLYVPERGYRSYDIASDFDTRSTFPRQKVVLYDTDLREYVRGIVLEYPGQHDHEVRVELDDGAITTVQSDNSSTYRLAGGEDWDELSESEQKDRLATDFDERIRDGYKDQQGYLNSPLGLTKPTDDRLDWVRDEWLSSVWDHYKDKWFVKEQIRNYVAQLGSEKKRAERGALGGVSKLDDSNQFLTVFLSKEQLKKYSSRDEDGYVEVLLHESVHALSASQALDHPGTNPNHEHVIQHADFLPSGLQTNANTKTPNGDPMKIPNDAKLQMFHDETVANSDPVGGSDWMKEAYEAAKNGESGIESYTPDFQTPENNALLRVHEAANHAYWLQVISAREKYKDDGGIDSNAVLFPLRAYGITNAEETLATFMQVMTATDSDLVDRLDDIDRLYPWFIVEWLRFFTPSDEVAEKLRELGYDV